MAEHAREPGRGLLRAPLLASRASCLSGIEEPSAKEISRWVSEEGHGTCWRSYTGEEAPPGLSIKPPHFSPTSHPGRPTRVPVALDNTAMGPGERRTQEELIRHHGQASLRISPVLVF